MTKEAGTNACFVAQAGLPYVHQFIIGVKGIDAGLVPKIHGAFRFRTALPSHYAVLAFAPVASP